MNDWIELHGQHRELRAKGGSALQDIRGVLRLLVKSNHADPTLMSRFTNKKNKDKNRREWYITVPPKAQAQKDDWSEPLLNLAPSIVEARLTILALTDESDVELVKFTVMLNGRNDAGVPFTVAAHLDDRHMGSGACGHSLFHCHVGPSLEAIPKVRVPLPSLRPAAALDWALSVVLPEWDPVPWQEVTAHFAPPKRA